MSTQEIEKLEELDDLDLDNVDDLDLDNVDLSKFGEVSEVINDPHIKFSTKSFINCLKALKQVCATSGRDVISKSFLLKAENGIIKVKATDFDTYYETEMECLNNENVCTDEIVIPLDVIMKLVQCLSANTIILKRDKNYFVHMIGGDMVLETYTVDTNKFNIDGSFQEVGAIAAPALSNILRDFGPLVLAAVIPADRRICFTKDDAVAAYTYSVIRHEGQFADFDLKVKDMKVLQVAIAGSDEVLKVYESTDSKAKRISIRGSKFSYTFLVSDIKANEKLVSTSKEVCKGNGTYIDYNGLSRLIRTAYELQYSVGKVNLNYGENDDLIIEIQTKKSVSSIFKLSGSRSGDIKPLDKPLVIQAKLFYTLLNSYRNDSAVCIILTDKCLGVKTDNYSGALLVE